MQLELFEIKQNNKFNWIDPWEHCEIPGCPFAIELFSTGLCYEHMLVYEQRVKENG